ncbi:hypothetical protein [Dyella nitratireducens]|uniref:Uncharacterized protein n=1 Tax=Dyella nitratireducens TaxID=1849580 RepID=A0ABQ1GZF3_9GAMM|nr:hypothetical protein [Dyella nitratireducens]GGA52745.1 hypothetical protein GCM10010981_47700 [Dyella nitratireducens]GLQ42476.1 hypothetical protein GCM10007902_23260 [Dyella nitratireducens]
MPVIHGSFHSFAHSSEHGIHYDDPSHSSETKPDGGGEGGHIPLKVTPEQNSFTPAASGLPPDSTPRKSTLQKVTSPTKQGDYVVDTKAPADANGSRPVYRRENDDIGTLKPTQERAIPDGKGGWKMVSDADAAKPAGAPALPPAAKIDPKQLGPLNDKGVYPGGDGNSYVRIGDDYHQVSYDKQIGSWMMVDPDRPHDFSKSVPVKLDGKGSAEALPKAGLKGGGGPLPSADTLREQLSQAQRNKEVAQREADTAQTALNQAEQQAQASLPPYEAADQRTEQISSEILRLDRERQRLQQSHRREPDPTRRENIQSRIDSIKQDLSSQNKALLHANEELNRTYQQHADDLRGEVAARRTLIQAQQRLVTATQEFGRLQNIAQAEPSL